MTSNAFPEGTQAQPSKADLAQLPHNVQKARVAAIVQNMNQGNKMDCTLSCQFLLPSRDKFIFYIAYREGFAYNAAMKQYEKTMVPYIIFNMVNMFDESTRPERRRTYVWCAIARSQGGYSPSQGNPTPKSGGNYVANNSYSVIQHALSQDNDHNAIYGNFKVANGVVPKNAAEFRAGHEEVCAELNLDFSKPLIHISQYTHYEEIMVSRGYLVPSDVLEVPSNGIVSAKILDMMDTENWMKVANNPLTPMSASPIMNTFSGVIMVDTTATSDFRNPSIRYGKIVTQPTSPRAQQQLVYPGIVLSSMNDKQGAEVIFEFNDDVRLSEIKAGRSSRVNNFERMVGKGVKFLHFRGTPRWQDPEPGSESMARRLRISVSSCTVMPTIGELSGFSDEEVASNFDLFNAHIDTVVSDDSYAIKEAEVPVIADVVVSEAEVIKDEDSEMVMKEQELEVPAVASAQQEMPMSEMTVGSELEEEIIDSITDDGTFIY